MISKRSFESKKSAWRLSRLAAGKQRQGQRQGYHQGQPLWTRLLLLQLLLMFVLFSLPGCQASGSNTTESSKPEGTQPVQSESAEPAESGQTRGESGVLRLWWSPHQDLNPLLDQSLSGQAAQTLVFQSLFERDPNWELQPVLVKNYNYSADRLQLTLVLESGISFHNGQTLTASDVLACLDFIKQAGPASPFYEDLAEYSSGRLMSDTTLILQLSSPDPDFLYALTFPVLPASETRLPAGSLIDGTGRYRMTGFSPAGELDLVFAGQAGKTSASLQRIQLKPYSSAIEAMRAMEDDQLDMVFLGENDLSYYDVRSSLRLDRFIGRHYVYLAINSKLGVSDNPVTRFASLKYQLRSARWFSLSKSWSGQSADLPIPAFHACFNLHPVDFEALWPDLMSGQVASNTTPSGQQPASSQPTVGIGRSLRIIAPADQPLLVRIAAQTKLWLEESGQAAETEMLAADLFQAALASQSYDLAVCESVIPPSAEPSWLLLETNVPAREQAQGLPADHPNGYDGDQSGLSQGWPFFGLLGIVRVEDPQAAATLSSSYRKTLIDAAMQTPYVGLMLRESAVAYGDRVQGQCLPSLNQPYRGIEDLWIWSGLSS